MTSTYQINQLRQECRELGEIFGANAAFYEMVDGLANIQELEAIRERALAEAYGEDY